MSKLARVLETGVVHRSIIIPSYTIGHRTFSGQKGLACGEDGTGSFIFQVEQFEGEESKITCEKCRTIK